MNNVRHYLRIDTDTQDSLQELCRQTRSTKAELMRRYVREGVKRHSANLAEWIEGLKRTTETMKTFDTPALHSPDTEETSRHGDGYDDLDQPIAHNHNKEI